MNGVFKEILDEELQERFDEMSLSQRDALIEFVNRGLGIGTETKAEEVNLSAVKFNRT